MKCTRWSSRWRRQGAITTPSLFGGTKLALKTPPERRRRYSSFLAIKAAPQITYEDRALVNFKDEEFGNGAMTLAQKKRFGRSGNLNCVNFGIAQRVRLCANYHRSQP